MATCILCPLCPFHGLSRKVPQSTLKDLSDCRYLFIQIWSIILLLLVRSIVLQQKGPHSFKHRPNSLSSQSTPTVVNLVRPLIFPTSSPTRTRTSRNLGVPGTTPRSRKLKVSRKLGRTFLDTGLISAPSPRPSPLGFIRKIHLSP